MDAAKQLKNDTVPFTPRAVSTNAPPLQIAMNPFVAGGSVTRMGRPMQTAFGEVVRQVALQTPVVVVVGQSGTGKSLLMDLAARACAEMGLSVRRVERGDQARSALDAKSDVLLVDEADSMSDADLRLLQPADGRKPATTMVLMCPPSAAGRFAFSDRRVATVELTPLTQADARNYLQERAASIGRTNLFTPEAMNLVIEGSRGLLRLLRSIAHLAYVAAAAEGAAQIGAQHVSTTSEPRSNATRAASPVQAFEPAPRQRPQPVAEPQTPPAAFESPKRLAEKFAPPAAAPAAKAPVKADPPMQRTQPREAENWSPRVIGLAGTLVAAVVMGAIVSWMAMSDKPAETARNTNVPVARPAVSKSIAQTPAPTAQTPNVVPTPPPQMPARSETATAKTVAPPKPAKAAPAQPPAPPATATAHAKPEPVTQAPAAPVPAPAPLPTATANENIPAPPPAVEPAPPAPDPAALAAAQAETQRAAEAKAAEEKAAAERVKAEEQAKQLAREVEQKARAEKAAADMAKAAKEAARQEELARQRTARQFNNSFLGVGR